MNVTWISHFPTNPSVKYVFNAWYQCVKCMNYKWMNFVEYPLLSCEMLSLWYVCDFVTIVKLCCLELYKFNFWSENKILPKTFQTILGLLWLQ
jgi:hypothetical protein